MPRSRSSGRSGGLSEANDARWIFVSNELGMAPHAATETGRKFVDLQGFLNQAIAARAAAVALMVAGIPLAVTGGDSYAPALRAGRRGFAR